MDKQKEIEEMANLIARDRCSYEITEEIAIKLYKAGYRKVYDRIKSKTIDGVQTSVIVPYGDLAKSNDEIEQLKHDKAVLERALENVYLNRKQPRSCSDIKSCKSIEEMFSKNTKECMQCVLQYNLNQAEKELAEEKK